MRVRARARARVRARVRVGAVALGMKDHLRPEGNPAPPRPRSPEAFMSAMICTGGGLGVGFGLAGIAPNQAMICSSVGGGAQPHSLPPTLALSLAPSLASLVRSPAPSSPSTACPRPHHRARLRTHRPPRSPQPSPPPLPAQHAPRRHPGMARTMQALMRHLPAPDREARSPSSCTYAGEVWGPRDTKGYAQRRWRVGLGGV